MPARPPCTAAALLAALCLALILAIPANPAAGKPGRSASVVSDLLFGAHTDKDPYSGTVDHVDALQRQLERRIGIVNWYQNWGGGEWIRKVQPDVVEAVTDSDRIPLLTWEPWDPAAGADQPRYRLRKLARGRFDAYATRWAHKLSKLGSTIYLRPMHEMNGNWYPWSGTVNRNSARDYRRAWRRLHRIFERVGADNVRWVWCPLNVDSPAVRPNRMERYYPGRKYVDVLALDGYNWGSTMPEYGGWQPFREVFGDAYRRLTKLGDQPIWIAEVGSAPEGGSKKRWVRGMFRTAKRWKRLEAIVWFDMDKERDWRAGPAASAF